MKEKIYAIVGPTASGKSSLALEIAERFDGEIVSCDSMQIYKRMNVGTAKPTAEEMARVRHHMIDIAEPTESFSCADYVTEAAEVIRDIHSRGKKPIVCGGTGLYLDALIRGSDFKEGITDTALREELMEYVREHGAEALYRELQRVDPESAAATHPNNVKRVVRAMEIYKLCGTPKSQLDRESREGEPRYDVSSVGLFYSQRDVLYERIERRVDMMLDAGLERETRELFAEGVFEKNATAAQAIGYKELLSYVRGEESLQAAVDRLKTATRRYAKRQITWFSAKDYVRALDVTENGTQKTFEEIVNITSQLFFC